MVRTCSIMSGLPRTSSTLSRASIATRGDSPPPSAASTLVSTDAISLASVLRTGDGRDLGAVALVERAGDDLDAVHVLRVVGDDQRVGLRQRLDVAEARHQRPQGVHRRRGRKVPELDQPGDDVEPAGVRDRRTARPRPRARWPGGSPARSVPERTAAKPWTRSTDWKRSQTPSSSSGSCEITVTSPVTAGSRISVRPVISDTCSDSARMSASRRLITKLASLRRHAPARAAAPDAATPATIATSRRRTIA